MTGGGLKREHRAAIIELIAANEDVEKAVLFGSRAMATHTVTSDVDIALFGGRLTLTDQARLAEAIDEIPMAQSVDLVLYDSIDNPALLEHIRTHGVEWYRRKGKDTSARSRPLGHDEYRRATDRLNLTPRHRRTLEALLRKHFLGVEVWAYGSRVNGRSHDGSDLDLVLRAPDLNEIPTGQLGEFEEAVRESNIPFLIDAKDWVRLPERFHREIEREYVVLVGTKDRRADGSWCETTLGNVIELKRGYDLPQRERLDGDIPVVSSSGVIGRHRQSKIAGPGVVTGRYGTLGQVFFIPGDFWPLNTALYVRDFKGNDPRFISYFLKALDMSKYADKAAVPGLNRNHLHQEIVQIPSGAAEQRAIAHILGTLDDKMELNRCMNETLEAMVQALFKSWFVDFGPVHAKMSGCDPGLPPSLADLFPDHVVDSELGQIPDGWEVQTIADHFEAAKGLSYKGSGLGSSGIPLHNLNSVCEGGGYKYEGIKYYGGEYSERHLVRVGDVIVANTEQGHERLLIGYAAVVPTFYGERGIASHHIYRLRRKTRSPITSVFLCHLLNSAKMHQIVSGYANGTTVNMLPIDGVQKPLIVCPPQPLVTAFDSLASMVDSRRNDLVSESYILAALRDSLLPKLISGGLLVTDVRQTVETI